MKAKRATRRVPGAFLLSLGVGLAVGPGGCADEAVLAPEVQAPPPVYAVVDRRTARTVHFAGDVDVVWNGGQGAGAPAGSDRYVSATLAAFPGVPAGSPGPGSFTFRVVNADGTVHREIQVVLTWAGLEDQATNPGEIRFLGVVVADTKPCGGSGHEGGTEGGGCSGGEDEGGCTHDDGGGCSGGEDEGGCTHDDGGGCSGGGGSGGPGEPGEPGGGGGGVNGSDCRIGQVVVGWAKDGGTPAVNGDRISWKWFAPDAPKVLQIQEAIASDQVIPWPCKLCEKEILGGNLVLFER